jgi:hypothetical protein
VPVSPTVPCIGCETMRSMSALPSASVAIRATGRGTSIGVEYAADCATGGRFGLALSLFGPLWQS